jgi:hypothetical protein
LAREPVFFWHRTDNKLQTAITTKNTTILTGRRISSYIKSWKQMEIPISELHAHTKGDKEENEQGEKETDACLLL